MTKRRVGGVLTNPREHGVADRHQRFFHVEAVAPLHFVARKRAERLADEVSVRHFDDGVRILFEGGVGDRGAEPLHEHRHSGLVDAPDGVDAERDLQVVAAEHGFVADEVFAYRCTA